MLDSDIENELQNFEKVLRKVWKDVIIKNPNIFGNSIIRNFKLMHHVMSHQKKCHQLLIRAIIVQ